MANILEKTRVELKESSPGIHIIRVPGMDPFNVLGGSTETGAGWTVILQRSTGKDDFNQNWATYKAGFGSLDGDFFLGLEKIYRLTLNQRHELYILLEELDGEIKYAKYDNFAIGPETDEYGLISVGEFSGNTTEDNMQHHVGKIFYTFDRDTAEQDAKSHHRGWWYDTYWQRSDTNGGFFFKTVSNKITNLWCSFDSFKKVQMLIRPKFD